MPCFADRLIGAVKRYGNAALVGIDPRYAHLPDELKAPADRPTPQQQADAFARFGCGIIDVVAGKVAAVKPQLAFFEQLGPPGLEALQRVIQHARRQQLIVILDGKRNDIGSTAAAYAAAYLGERSVWQGDALTVNPYLGDDSLTPFVHVCQTEDAGLFVLVKTSNPGSPTFQDLRVEGQPLYRRVAAVVEHLAAESVGQFGYGNIGAVVGATYPEQLAELRAAMPHALLLVPGYGAQGAGAVEVQPAFDSRGLGALVNSSRSVIFAYERDEFQTEAAQGWQRAVAAATDRMTAELRLPTQ